MGREVRRVPANWEHPKTPNGTFVPLQEGYEDALESFARDIKTKGLAEAIEYHGGGPLKDDYMLVGVPAEARTYYMMYEDTSEGTPISPAFATPEDLARWLADTRADATAGMTASYEQWLRVCKGAWAPSMVYDPEHGVRSGVAACADQQESERS